MTTSQRRPPSSPSRRTSMDQIAQTRLTAAELGWPFPVSRRIAELVERFEDRGMSIHLRQTEQFKAVAWLMKLSPESMVLPNTTRGEEFFWRIMEFQVLVLEDEVVSLSELSKALTELSDARANLKKALHHIGNVPDPVKRFNYDATIVGSFHAAESSLDQRIQMIEGEIELLGKISTRPKGNQALGRHANWVADLIVRNCADFFLNITGFQPDTNLPVRSFAGFLERYGRNVPTLAEENFPRLAKRATDPQGYKGEFIPFESLEEEQFWIATRKHLTK